jgi:hypothetical protein
MFLTNSIMKSLRKFRRALESQADNFLCYGLSIKKLATNAFEIEAVPEKELGNIWEKVSALRHNFSIRRSSLDIAQNWLLYKKTCLSLKDYYQIYTHIISRCCLQQSPKLCVKVVSTLFWTNISTKKKENI